MPMLRPQKEKKPPQPGKLKMFGHIGHLGHLTPNPQQNCPFFNLSNMANTKYLGHLGHLTRPRTPALRSSASPAARPQPPLVRWRVC